MADDELPIEVEALALKALESRVKTGLAATKALAQKHYTEGQSRKFRSPSGLKLGTFGVTDPNPVWQVTDPAALEAHLWSYPGNVEAFAEITDTTRAIEVLREHAPWLLAEVTRIKQDARDAAMEAARAGDQVPGIAQVKPVGVPYATPDRTQARDAVSELVAAGRLTWDGRRVLEQKTEEAS